MTQTSHQIGPHPTPSCHTPDMLALIQHMDTRKHKQIHKLIELNNKFIKAPDFNQSVVDHLRHQTEQAHSMHCLHQQTTDALHNIAKSLGLQENLHFIHDIPMFKAKDPQSFDEWLDQIDKVTALANNNPNKLALAEFQGSFSKTIDSYPPTLGWNRIKDHFCYNFGSVTTKQHAASMLIDQQQKPYETLPEYVQ